MTLLRPWRREAGAGLMSFDKSVHLENHNLPHSGRGWKDIEHTNMMPTPGPHISFIDGKTGAQVCTSRLWQI